MTEPTDNELDIVLSKPFIDLRELDANTLRDISVKSGVIWPEDGDRESRLFRFRVSRIATEAYRRCAEILSERSAKEGGAA